MPSKFPELQAQRVFHPRQEEELTISLSLVACSLLVAYMSAIIGRVHSDCGIHVDPADSGPIDAGNCTIVSFTSIIAGLITGRLLLRDKFDQLPPKFGLYAAIILYMSAIFGGEIWLSAVLPIWLQWVDDSTPVWAKARASIPATFLCFMLSNLAVGCAVPGRQFINSIRQRRIRFRVF